MKITEKSLVAIACLMALTGTAAAQVTPSGEPSIVVTAPQNLSEKQMKEWDKLNREAARLEKRLVTLREQILDDRAEVSEAQRRLERAQSKLDRENNDLTRTGSRIKDAEKDRSRIEKKRIKILTGGA